MVSVNTDQLVDQDQCCYVNQCVASSGDSDQAELGLCCLVLFRCMAAVIVNCFVEMKMLCFKKFVYSTVTSG